MKRKKIAFLLFNLKMPKRKSSLGRSTKNAKRKKETRANEDENSYPQTLDKDRMAISRQRTDTSNS